MQITSPNGRWLAFTYGGGGLTAVNDNAGRTWTYSYDQYSRLTTATDPEGGQWRYTWPTPNGTAANYRIVSVIDPRQNTMVTNEYDANGRVIKQTYADLTTNQFAYVVDGAGKVTQTDITDRRGTIRRVEFDSTGRVSRNTFALGKPEQQVTTYTREAGTNLLTSMTDALGRRTDYSYDSQGNLLTTTRLAGTTDAVTTKYTYGAYGLVTSIEDPLHHTTLLDYDALGNLTRVTDPDPVSNQTNLTYNSQGQPLTVTNAPNQTITYTYDAGIVASVSDPLSRTAQMFSDAVGRIYGVRDPLGNLTQTVYDALDRVTQTTDPLGNTVRYEYDENGNLRAHVDQKGNRTEYAYDAMNRLTSRKDALLHTESYAYDVASRLQRFTDRKSQVSGFVYDALNRRTQAGFGATIGNPTAYGSTIDYTYDAGNRLIRVNDSQIGVPITRSYDGLDRLTGETTALAAVAFSYDAAGRRQTRTVPGQAMMTYAWDNANRLLSVTQGTHAVAFTYDNVNRRTKVALPNGIDIDYTYDAAGQLTGITYRQGTTTLGDLTYAYDNAGRRISVGGGFARTDLPVTIATTSHNANNQLTQWGAPTLTYDFNGNLTGDGTYSYTWDARSQLIQVQQGVTTIASYQYDAFGRRQQKVVNGTTTQFVYDGKNFVQERDEIGSITADLLTGLGMDEIYARTKGAITSSFLTDHLGTIIAEADANGLIQTNYSYEPYGKTKQNGTASDNSQRYTGREQDTADLYYYRARYYSPSLDRFMAEDPIGLDGGVNPYSYVLGNPLSFADPTGQMSALGIAVCGGAALLAYASYKLYSSYSCQKDCEEDCDKKHKCDQGCPMAEGDTHAHQQCKGACILTCWGGMGKKGPKGPKPTDPPNSPPITPIPVLPK
jgi:RHS repeat-associated protein